MKAISKSPNYLIRNRYSYCFRMRVPADLQSKIGRKELRYSLRTGYIGEAKLKARILAAQVQLLFSYLRNGAEKLKELSNEKIQELAQQNLKDYVEGLETRYLDDDCPIITPQDTYAYIDTLNFIKEDIIGYLGCGDYRTVEREVKDILDTESKDMSTVYADPFPPKQLYKEIISKIDYNINLSHLKKSKWVVKG